MLKQLHIQNYAIIKSVDIPFSEQLNIITGETGAGKSIVMGALGLILGERADTKVLLNQEEKCVVEGTFYIKPYKLKDFFEAHELDYDHTCVIRREITPQGKTRAFINDTPVNLNQLKELGEQLVDIVGQHQTLELNDTHFPFLMVDAIAGNDDVLNTYEQLYKTYKLTEKKLAGLIEQENQARADEDYFKFILHEINEINPLPDEQEQLEKQLELLSNAEVIQQQSASAARLLSGEEQSLIDGLNQLKSELATAAKHYSPLQQIIERIQSCTIELKDVAGELEQIAEDTQADPENLAKIESRLQALFNLQKKHRVLNNVELIAFGEDISNKLSAISSLGDQIKDTQTLLNEQIKQLQQLAETLSNSRKKAIPQIEKQVNALLVQVQMPDAQIQIKHTESKENKFTPNGIDALELLFSANKGGQFQPVNKVASGGELSRLMLCIKSIISDKMALPTIVFDEIDTGISGEAAQKVSKVLKAHAAKHQVIAITHLPQIAGKADSHIFIFKQKQGNSTQTGISLLNEQERVAEIARMLHGENPSEKVLEAAKELMG